MHHATVTVTPHGTFAANAVNFQLDGLNDGETGEDWDEATITHNNAPAVTGVNTLDVAKTTAVAGSFTLYDDHIDEGYIASSSALLDFIKADTDGRVTFILRYASDQGNKTAWIYSKEGGDYDLAPKLSFLYLRAAGTLLTVH